MDQILMTPDQADNTLPQLRAFFDTEANPCPMPEFKNFWLSCTDELKAYFKRAPLVMASV